MAGRSSSSSSRPHHHHGRHRSETSAPATSVAVAAARAGDAPRSAQQRRDDPSGGALRRSPEFPPRCQQPQQQARCSPRCARRRGRLSVSAGEIYELLVDEGGVVEAGEAAVVWPAAAAPSEEAGELEKEVWARFRGAGFWRSPSQLGDQMR